jgi:hypothetical protein
MQIATWQSGQIAVLRSSVHLVQHGSCSRLPLLITFLFLRFRLVVVPSSLSLYLGTPYSAVLDRAAALDFLYRTDDAPVAAHSFSSASPTSPATEVSSSASTASVLVPCQQFRSLGRQAKAAAALGLTMQSFAAAGPNHTSTSATNGSGGASTGGGGLSTFSGIHRVNSNLKLRAMAILKAQADASQSSVCSLLSSTIPATGSRSTQTNPPIHSSAIAMGSISASGVSTLRSVSSSSVFPSLLPGLLPPLPGFKRFSLVDSHGKYLPLVKDYATDPKRGQCAPVLDLNSPPFCCPFNVYTTSDHERERQKEIRRCEARKAASAAEAVEAAEAAEQARRAAKIAQVVKEALNAELQSSSLSLSPSSLKSLILSLSSSSLLSPAATAPINLHPTTRERSGQVRRRIHTSHFMYFHFSDNISALSPFFVVPLVVSRSQEQTDLTTVYEREMAIKRAKNARPGYCELCGKSYKALGNVRPTIDSSADIIVSEFVR